MPTAAPALPDLQSSSPENPYPLSRVGVAGVQKPVRIRRPGGREYTYVLTFEVGVDLPAEQKGSHLSRNVEVLAEIVDESVRDPTEGIEHLCAEICRRLLERHQYASWAECKASCDHFGHRSGRRVRYGLTGLARAHRGAPILRRLGVVIPGLSGGDSLRVDLEIPQGVEVEAQAIIDGVERSLETTGGHAAVVAAARARLAGPLAGLAPGTPVLIEGRWGAPDCTARALWQGSVGDLAVAAPAPAARRPRRSVPSSRTVHRRARGRTPARPRSARGSARRSPR